jgi:benzoyl-CoA reductase subunit C
MPKNAEMSGLARFSQVVNDRHGYAKEWKAATGRRVLGYFCDWVPEEIFYAAGFMPVRILGSQSPGGQTLAQRHISATWCSYCRECLAEGLLGKYDYLDGIAIAHGCWQIRQAHASWTRNIPMQFDFYNFVPFSLHEKSAQDYLPQELHRFKAKVEGSTGTPISVEALRQAIEVYNTNRRLMRQIYELRKADIPPISSAEVTEMVLASMYMDKEEHNEILMQVLEELPRRVARQVPRARLMLVGSVTTEVELYRFIESMGAEVVIDDNCIGTRYFWDETPVTEDPITGLARRFVERIPCPLYDCGPESRRLPTIETFAKDYRVDGALLIQLKFCDVHEYDMPAIEALFRGMNIPTLRVETDLSVPGGAVGQLRTRIEAMLEMMELEVA